MKAYIKLSDTIPNPSSHTAPGFRFPGEYKWNAEYGDHILDGRIFDLEHEPDRITFNEAVMNHCRVQHRYHFPIVVVIKRMVESGFDEPAVVTVEQTASVYAQQIAPAPVTVEADPADSPGPPTTPGARKKARQLSVDMETLRGQGTGAGGIITVEDVIGQWHRDGGNPATPPAIAGPIQMADLLAASADAQ